MMANDRGPSGRPARYPLRTCRSRVALYQPANKQRSLTSQKAEVVQSCVPIAADDHLEITPTGPGLSSPVYRRYRCSLQTSEFSSTPLGMADDATASSSARTWRLLPRCPKSGPTIAKCAAGQASGGSAGDNSHFEEDDES